MAFPQASDYRPPIIPDGEVYDNPDNGKSYYWTQILLPEGSTPDTATSIGGYWTVVCESSKDEYVKKVGDTMTGTLEIANEGDVNNLDFDPNQANLTFTTTKADGSDSRSVSIHQNGLNSSLSITGDLVVDGNYYTESGRYYGSDPNGQDFAERPPYLQLEQNEGTLQWGDSPRLEWNASNVEIPKPAKDNVNSDGFIIRGTTASGYETDEVGSQDGKILSVFHNADKADAVNYEGRILSGTNLVNKQYVDDKDDLLRQDIIELEEEIDAIAPSIEYGTWKFKQPNDGSIVRPPEPGTFFLINGSVLTNQYKETTAIKIHNDEFVAPDDQDPVDNHTWDNADVGELIQLFDAADPDFFLGRITAKSVDEPGEFVTLTVDRIQSSGTPDDNVDPVTKEYLTRINIFTEPTGGDASEFVKKIGDTMSGNLTIDRSTGTADVAAALILKGERSNTTNSAATIKFENAKNSSNPGYLTYKSSGSSYWFGFDQDVDLNNHGLHSVKQIRMQHGAYIGAGTKERIKVRDPSNNNDGNAGVSIERPPNGRRGFAIRGTNKANNEIDILWSHTNAGDDDAINYDGKMTNDNNLVNKKYVDDAVSSFSDGPYVRGNFTITESNGNYYIT